MFDKIKQKFQRNRPANHPVMNSRMFAAAQGNRLVDRRREVRQPAERNHAEASLPR